MRHRDYRRYTIGAFLSTIGTWTQRVAVGWLTWELTHSYAWLGIIAFADLFVSMLFAPLAGEMADRMDRLKLSVWAQWAQMAQAVALASMVLGGFIDRWSLFGLTVLSGIAHAYHASARLAVVPSLVPREDLTPAIAINSLIFNASRFIGPAIAGVIILNFGIGPTFVFNSITFLCFIWVLTHIKVHAPEHQSSGSSSAVQNIIEAVRYAAHHKGIAPMMLMLGVTSLAGRSLPDLLPGFADGVFARGPAGLAWLTAAMGIGATLSTFVLMSFEGIKGITKMTITCLLVLGISTLAFAMLDVFWLAVGILVVVGLSMNLSGIGTLNLLQNTVDGEMRGRVMSLYFFLHQGAPAVGTLVIGVVAEHTGLSWPVGFAGASVIAVWVVMARRQSALRDILEVEQPKAPSDQS
jgi:MFS family permease